ncbi:MAG: hypothetical protein PVG25_08090 [Anaerolineae bacterium]|jgi:hypothetical protein
MTDEKSILEKNIEMWEKMTGSYMDAMFKTVERTMEQSTAFREQMDKAVAKTFSAQFDAMLTAMNALQRQVEMLNDRIDEMLEERE